MSLSHSTSSILTYNQFANNSSNTQGEDPDISTGKKSLNSLGVPQQTSRTLINSSYAISAVFHPNSSSSDEPCSQN